MEYRRRTNWLERNAFSITFMLLMYVGALIVASFFSSVMPVYGFCTAVVPGWIQIPVALGLAAIAEKYPYWKRRRDQEKRRLQNTSAV